MKKIMCFANIKFSNLLILFIGLFAIGCKKFVAVDAPLTQIATNSVFGNSAAATSAQLAIYLKMTTESFSMAQAGGLLSDELQNYSSSVALVQFYQNSMTAVDASGPWSRAYGYIYQANDIIARLQNNGNIPVPIVAQLTGESKFIRAFWYFYLTNLYGDVPLVLITDYTVNGTMARIAQAKVYQQIVADLKDAQNSLNANYIDASDTAVSTDRFRPTQGAASALLARVYLYEQKYDSAEGEANLTINNSKLYSLCSNLSPSTGTNYVFQKNSTEAIWQLAPPLPTGSCTIDGLSFILTGAPGTGLTKSATISTTLMNSFETGDNRMKKWVGVYTAGSSKYYYPLKYQVGALSGQVTSYSAITETCMMLRLAEQYLIRAEARAQQGNILGASGAIADLNTIRHRAGLGDYAGGTDQASVLAAILHERQVELFTEWGHRWFDLKRTSTIDAVMGGTNGASHAKGGTWNSTGQWLPIPQTEINNDINLKQNSGY